MSVLNMDTLRLRAELLLRRIGAPVCVAVMLCMFSLVASVWAWQQRLLAVQMEARPLPSVPLSAMVVSTPPVAASDNLGLFYDVLGQPYQVEQQVKLLFDLAAKNGLVLAQGEYKSSYDKASRVASYQVTLPLKGSYQAVWQFALQALRAVPFASLDELSFRREQIADARLEARLRLTFYLSDVAAPAIASVP